LRALDIFVLLRFLTYFLGALVILVVLFVAVDVMTNLNRFGSSASVLFSYYIYYVPYVAQNMVPVAALLALVSLVAGFVRTSELVAMHSLGYSLPSALRSVIVFLILLVFFMVWVGDVIIPYAMEKRNYIFYIEMKKKPDSYAKTKTKNIWYRTKSSLINFENVLDENNVQGIHIYFLGPEWNLIRTIDAENLVLKSNVWTLKEVTDSQLLQDQGTFQITNHETLDIQALTELESMKLSGNAAATEYMSSSDLWKLIKQNEEISLDTNQLKIYFYSKFTFALSVLILPLLGLCTVSVNRRSGNMFLSGAIAVLLVFVYWMLYNSMLSFGRSGTLSPLFAAIFIPILASVCIFFAIRRVLN
jgi:lipopolysaccharide export system permease protein